MIRGSLQNLITHLITRSRLEPATLVVQVNVSIWKLTGGLATVLPRHLLNISSDQETANSNSWLQYLIKCYDSATHRLIGEWNEPIIRNELLRGVYLIIGGLFVVCRLVYLQTLPACLMWSIAWDDTDWLVQERRISIASALESRLSCTNPSISSCMDQ